MLTIKNCQILLYYHFNKIRKAWNQFPLSSLEPQTCQKYFSYSIIVTDQVSFSECLGFKRNKHKRKFHYLVMPMMMSQILKSVDFTKAQKSRYLENKILFLLQIKKMDITKPCTHLFYPALCNTLNVIRTKMLHVIGQFPQIQIERFKVVHFN